MSPSCPYFFPQFFSSRIVTFASFLLNESGMNASVADKSDACVTIWTIVNEGIGDVSKTANYPSASAVSVTVSVNKDDSGT